MRLLEHFPNLVAMFFARAREKGDAPFLWAKQDGEWRSISWRDAASEVARLSAALRRLGLNPGDRVMLVSENRPEWLMSDLAIMAAGCVTVPAYSTNTERDHQHILDDSGARCVIVSTTKLAKPLLPAAIRANACEHVIGMDPLPAAQSGTVRFHARAQLIAAETLDAEACAAQATFTRDDLACLIYTSGTGGAPRGVMQHHGAILHNVEACAALISEDFGWGEEIFLSFLPASHAYEHTGGQMFPIGLGAQIYYSEGLEKLATNIEEVRPTIMVVVPRLFEVLRQRILNAVEKEGRFKAYLLNRALSIGAKDYAGHVPLWDRPMDLFLSRTVRPRIAARFGGRIKAMVSGGAPLNPEVGIFFHALGLTLLQGYGQTEAAPVISCNRPKVGLKMSTVGPPLLNTEVKIAEDGEILVRGELVMKGYWRNEAETARALQDGWLHTGDVGYLDEKGRIVITDRKKDIIVLDKGDNVSPQKIEGMLTLQGEILQAMVVGDKRPYVVGLIVPDPEWSADWCAANKRSCKFADMKTDPDFIRALSAAVDRVNADLSVIEKVRRFIVADEPFTVENEQLTPSIKIRRHVIRGIYGERLDALYKR
ncbi:AMP-dependent synthetase/ligase [Sphingosinicella ginsenosidimutans]|uniref:Long-chain fatty acid--CoA ligase n=1 Tax=Allosphingosinicella ginsenosidimutans TaxID=1176539 RepID=A0A5C6TSB3_9SPHN|nr:long-chain fatty acid--CoA ligase [Sphingosinicella ginsenosidimutans]TXC63342.1 long-chain fatty acid--CoA ligase [Sphingosinicella ginsenosidimutans]